MKRLLAKPSDRREEERLARLAAHWHKPTHVGVILDGNRRFARQVGMANILDGHASGADKLHEALDWFREFDIHMVTIWIFSTDNFHRQETEVSGLLSLIERKTHELIESDDVHRNRVRVRYLGRIHLLPEGLRQAIREAEEATADYADFLLNVAIAYGGREELTDAFRRYLAEHAGNGTSPADLAETFDAEALEKHLYTAGLPDPDLIIRTSGEQRLSGFLLWQSAYAEYYFCDSLWPQFRRLDLLRALQAYHTRQRRYGR